MRNRIIDDRYELLRTLKSGAFGVVYYAWDLRFQRAVAVRETVPGRISVPGAFEAYRDDIPSAHNLGHPNIVVVHDLRQDEHGHIYTVMEFLDGIDLGAVLERLSERGKCLPPSAALHVAGALLDALEYAHSAGGGGHGSPAGVVHGDVSPPNIILLANGSVKLIGFGTARVRRILAEQAPTKRSGHLACLSPEHIANRPVDGRADLFSLGIILHQMLLGQSPFRAEDQATLVRMMSRAEYDHRPLDHARLATPVREIIETCLQADPNDRYPDARTMRERVSASMTCLEGADPHVLIVGVVEAVQTEQETAERKRLLLIRGGQSQDHTRVSTTPLERPPIRADSHEAPAAVPGPKEQAPSPHGPVTVSGQERFSEESSRRLRSPSGQRKRRRIVWPALVLIVVVYAVLDIRYGFGPVRAVADRVSAWTAGPQVEWHVVSIPSGADVLIDGESVGETPCDFAVTKAGLLLMRIELPGYRAIDTVLSVDVSQEPPELPEFVFYTPVHFNSVPTGADVILNGQLLSPMESARFTVAATETVTVEYVREGEVRLPPAHFNPINGLIPPTDTTFWEWRFGENDPTGVLTGSFFRSIRVHSRPPGATVFVDADSVAAGRTNLILDLPYGDHRILLRRDPFLDYRFTIRVGQDTPDTYTPVLRRTVYFSARDTDDPTVELNASIEWIRQDSTYVKTPLDRITTPYSTPLAGLRHMVHFRRNGFADTTLELDPEAGQMVVSMRRLPVGREGGIVDNQDGDKGLRWVRFVVRVGRDAVAGAEVIGIEKTTGNVVRYGLTDEAGELLTRVPIGNYKWQAAKSGYKGRTNSERIKKGRDFKTVRLRLARQH